MEEKTFIISGFLLSEKFYWRISSKIRGFEIFFICNTFYQNMINLNENLKNLNLFRILEQIALIKTKILYFEL